MVSARTGDGTGNRVNNTNNSRIVDYMGQSEGVCDNGPLAGRYREQRFQWKSGCVLNAGKIQEYA